jgi:hypothetical protein
MKIKFGLFAILIIGVILVSGCIRQPTGVGGLGSIRGYLFEVDGKYYFIEDIPSQSGWEPPTELIGVWTQEEITEYTQSDEIYPYIVTPTPPPNFFKNVKNAANEKLQEKIIEFTNEYEEFNVENCVADYESKQEVVQPIGKSWEEVCRDKREETRDTYTLLSNANLEVRVIYDSTASISDVMVMAVKNSKYYWSCYVNPSDYSVSDWKIVHKNGVDIFTVEKAEYILKNYLEQKGITGGIKTREYVTFRSQQLQKRLQRPTS